MQSQPSHAGWHSETLKGAEYQNEWMCSLERWWWCMMWMWTQVDLAMYILAWLGFPRLIRACSAPQSRRSSSFTFIHQKSRFQIGLRLKLNLNNKWTNMSCRHYFPSLVWEIMARKHNEPHPSVVTNLKWYKGDGSIIMQAGVRNCDKINHFGFHLFIYSFTEWGEWSVWGFGCYICLMWKEDNEKVSGKLFVGAVCSNPILRWFADFLISDGYVDCEPMPQIWFRLNLRKWLTNWIVASRTVLEKLP